MEESLNLGWALREGKTPYFIPPVELSEGEKRIFIQLCELLLQNPSGELPSLLKRYCEEKNVLLDKAAGEKIVSLAERCVRGLGIFDFLLQDDELEEISVVGLQKPVFVFHRKKGWMETNAFISSEEHALDLINKIARPLGRRVTTQNPRVNAILPDGSRLHASIPPVCPQGVEITIRKFLRNPLNARELCDLQTLSLDAAAFLWAVLYGDVSLCIAGNTGSGKTTTLNALFSFIPLNERIVVTEETPELFLLHEHCVKILANEELGVGMKDLVKDTLRMRPDRVVVGEVRSAEETQALFDSLLAGQAKGSFFTFHAKSAGEALQRMQSFGIANEDLNAVDLILVQKRISFLDKKTRAQKELRRVTEICEVAESKPRVLFETKNGRLEKTGGFASSLTVEKVLANYGFSKKEFAAEVQKRKKFLLAMQWLDFRDFTLQTQDYAFGQKRAVGAKRK